MKIQSDAALEAKSQEIKEQMAALSTIIDQQRLDIEKTNVKLTAYEKLLEERRLNEEKSKETKKEPLSIPPITINMPSSKANKRVVKFNSDDKGELSGAEIEDLIDEGL